MGHVAEDKWAHQAIGTPFPDDPVKCFNQQNQYVALGYIHGKPVHGRAWNNGGKVECSFPYLSYELTGPNAMGGNIQILQYKGDHNSLGFWYNWIKYSERAAKPKEERHLVKCGASMPILWYDRAEGALLGYLDLSTEVASFPHDGKITQKKGKELADMLIIVKELVGGPAGCECAICSKNVVRSEKKLWTDAVAGTEYTKDKNFVLADNRPLNTLPGESTTQLVALWYLNGNPIMGRAWNDNGLWACCFAGNGHEFRANKVGSMQVLVDQAGSHRTFDYIWLPYAEAVKIKPDDIQERVRIATGNVDVSPALFTIDGKEILGGVDVRSEKASIGLSGTEKALSGPAARNCKILCRKAKPGLKIG